MRNLVPQFILQQLADGQTNGRFPAVCLFVDTSGFTQLTSSAMAYERVGAELIADILAKLFKPLVHMVYQEGGYLAGFAGDSFKAIFPLAETAVPQTAYRRCVSAAWQIRSHVLKYATVKTRFGAFQFAVKATVADGEVEWGIWTAVSPESDRLQQYAYYIEGEALTRCLAADAHAQAGELLLTNAVYTAVADLPLKANFENGHWRLQSVQVSHRHLRRDIMTLPPHLQSLAKSFYPTEMMPEAQGEFRQVVTLFINLQTLPKGKDENQFASRLFRLLHKHGGYLCRVGRIGDKDSGSTLLLFWGAPISHENDTLHALHFAWELLQGTPFPAKAGLSTNLAYAGYVGAQQREEYTCHGVYVNLAARQMVLSEWGTILLDAHSAKLVEDQFDVTYHGAFSLKGFAEEQPVYRVQARRSETAVPFYHGSLIGRQDELTLLETAILPIFSRHFAGMITLIGEAGIGKSRLIHTYLTTLATEPHPGTSNPLILLCQTDEILRQSLNPFRYMLRQLFLQQLDVSEAINQQRFAEKMAMLIAETADPVLRDKLERILPFLQSLLNLPVTHSLYNALEPKLRFENTFVALKTLLIACSMRQPVILHLEDAHWLDDDSITFLSQLTRNMSNIPLAILVSTRNPLPDVLLPTDPRIPQTVIHMQPLPTKTLRAFARDILHRDVDNTMLTFLEKRTNGNPFFMEQMLLYWRDRGFLSATPTGFIVSKSGQSMPTDVRSILIARLDQLIGDVKEVVQTAAVLGREFELPLLSHMLQEDRHLLEKIDAAERAAIWSAVNEFNYLFKHALLRDAAYDMQRQSRLRQMHLLAAESILQLYPTELATNYADIAYHYDRAGAASDAVLWYKLAGEHAARLFANVEAEQHFSRALALTAVTDKLVRYQLLLGRETIFKRQGRREEQAADLEMLKTCVTALADGSIQNLKQQAEIALRQANYTELVSDFETAVQHTETAVKLAQSAQDNTRLANAYLQWGKILWPQSQFDSAIDKLQTALQLGQQAKMPRIEAAALGYLGVVADLQGSYEQAKRYQQHSLMLFKQLNDQEGITSNLNNIGITHLKQGAYEEARSYLEQALQNHRAIGYRSGESWALANLGFVAALLGQYNDANHHYMQALAIFQELGDVWSEGMAYGHLGLCAANQGAFSQAMRDQEEALAIFKKVGYRQGEGMAVAAIGSLTMRLGNYEEALVTLERALRINRELKVQRGQAQVLVAMSLVNHFIGDDEAALQCAEEALTLAEGMGERQIQATVYTNLGVIHAAQESSENAESYFEKALTLRRALGEHHLAVEALAGLIEIRLAQNGVTAVQPLVDDLLLYLADNPLDGVDDPGRIYLSVIDALRAAKKGAAARQLIGEAYQFLQNRAEEIENSKDKHSFLNHISSNREIKRLYQLMQP